MAELDKYRAEADDLVVAARSDMSEIKQINSRLEIFTNQSKVDFPKRADDISAKHSPFLKQQREAELRLTEAEEELKNHKAGEFTDYAKLGDGTSEVAKAAAWTKAEEAKFRSKIGELYKSYAKIIEDMRVDYYVSIGRVSWDEYYDYPTENSVIYDPVKVGEDVYEYFNKLDPEKTLASISGWGLNVHIDKTAWNSLKIDPEKNWPSGDDAGEFWAEDAFMRTYHKYTIIEDQKKRLTDWVEVDEDDFEENIDNLGMEIVSKPYGYFEEEKLEEASPAGMSAVGDPKHGEWRNDSTGQSFWYYYGIYSFLNGGSRDTVIYRDGYNDWNRNYRGREGYYGQNRDGTQRYGTGGSHVRTSPRYSGTTYAKTGGLKTAPASVRGQNQRGGGLGKRGK
jgi:hypothetical protein